MWSKEETEWLNISTPQEVGQRGAKGGEMCRW